MNMQISYSGCFKLNSRETAISQVLETLRDNVRVDLAKVRVERSEDSAYPFRVNAHIVTPGPDVIAEGRDYTFEAALRKLKQGLMKAVQQRKEKRERRKSLRKSGAARGVKPGHRG